MPKKAVIKVDTEVVAAMAAAVVAMEAATVAVAAAVVVVAAVVEAVEVVSVVVAAGEYIVSNHNFDCVFLAEAVVAVADVEVDSAEAVVVVAEDSMVVAVAADQLRIRKIALPPQVCLYVFFYFWIFCLTFSNFFVELLLFEFFFYSIFRTLNFRVSIFINVSNLEFRFSDFEFFDISIFRVSNNFRIFFDF